MGHITSIGLAAARTAAARTKRERWLREPLSVHGAGAWAVRVMPSGKAHTYWYGQQRGKRLAPQPLGLIGPELSIAQAREKAAALGAALRSGGLQAVAEARPIATTRDAGGGLEELLEVYAAHLEGLGKRRSAQDVRSSIRTHVAPHRLAKAKAAAVEPEELVKLIRPVVEAGKLRAAKKLRTFLVRAYGLAVASRLDPRIGAAFAAFGARHNPAASLPTIEGGNGSAGDRHLDERDLRAFVRALLELDSTGAQAVTAALWLGGQRGLQLARVRLEDLDGDELRILDPKGKREHAREHWLPLAGRAANIVAARAKAAREAGEPWLFFSVDTKTGKRAHVRVETMNDAVKAARDAAEARGHKWSEAARGFTLADLRRTAETSLARRGVSKDVRAQLLSHGLAGVQSRHYDRHDYMAEKRQALRKWGAYLERLAKRGAR
jgi:hypothetical protein